MAEPKFDSSHALTDSALAARIAAGDRRAFELLMRRYNRRLYRVARATLGEEREAEDALQDAYLAAYRSVEETARCLDVAQATVRTRHFRARALLRDSLARDIDVAERDLFDFGGERCDRIVANVLAALDAGT